MFLRVGYKTEDFCCAIYTLSCRSSLIQAPQAGEPGKKELQSEVKVLLIFSIKFFPEHFCCSSERCTVCGMLIIMTGRKLVAGAEGSLLFGPDFKSPHSVPTLWPNPGSQPVTTESLINVRRWDRWQVNSFLTQYGVRGVINGTFLLLFCFSFCL